MSDKEGLKQIIVTWTDEAKEPLITFKGELKAIQISSLNHLIPLAYRRHLTALRATLTKEIKHA